MGWKSKGNAVTKTTYQIDKNDTSLFNYLIVPCNGGS